MTRTVVRTIARVRIQHILLAAILFNIVLTFTPFTLRTWDSETHLFFADHYVRGWFDPWEEKWMTGFWVWGYPPLAHQLIAAFSFLMGLEYAYKLVQLIFISALPFSVWWMSRILIGDIAAKWAALCSIFVPGIYIMLYTFGQIPTFVGLVLALAAAGWLLHYLEEGRWLQLVSLGITVAATMTAHHYTVITTIPLLFSTLGLTMILRKPKVFKVTVVRLVIAGLVVGFASAIAIAPFWWWYFAENLPQAEIPHTTRRMFLDNAKEAELFFWGTYGSLMLMFPITWVLLFRKIYMWPLMILIVFMSVMGLGTMTPLPKFVFFFANTWQWLTYERFSAWAAMLSVIPLGVFLERIAQNKLLITLIVGILILFSVREATYVANHMVQPEPLQQWEEEAIVKFLEEDDHNKWRYVTFGLGEAGMARISRLTTAPNIDGAYYTGRIPKEFRDSGIGVIDAAKWWGERGYPTIFPILQEPENWNLKFAIVADPWIEMHLANSHWQMLHPVGGDIDFTPVDPQYSHVRIWEAPKDKKVEQLKEAETPPYPKLLAYLWGVFPLGFLFLTILVSTRFAWKGLVDYGSQDDEVKGL